MPTQVYNVAGNYTFDTTGVIVTGIRVYGSGGGGVVFGGGGLVNGSGGGGGGFISGLPTDLPSSLAVTLLGGGNINGTNAGAQTTVSWDATASYLVAAGGHGGRNDGAGGNTSSAGNVTQVVAMTGANASGSTGGVGANGAGNGGNGGSVPTAGGADRVEIDYFIAAESIIAGSLTATGDILRGVATADGSMAPVTTWPVFRSNWLMSINDTGGTQQLRGDQWVQVATRKFLMCWPGQDLQNGDAVRRTGTTELFRLTNINVRREKFTGEVYLRADGEEFAP